MFIHKKSCIVAIFVYLQTNHARQRKFVKDIASKQWKKEDELKGLKSELAAIDRKIQRELAKDKELEQQVANGTDGIESVQTKRHSIKK